MKTQSTKIESRNCQSKFQRWVSWKHLCFFIFLPLYLVLQIFGCFAHLLVFIFDDTYDHSAALDTLYPIVKHYKRFFTS